ncbi:MAG: diguanylate cyclase [Clostridia bacterium]|nr:diguanylate cyclase [Clostridia bacterium]
MGLVLISIFLSLHNYLLFHTLVELLAIIVAFSMFQIAISTQDIYKNDYFLFLGIAYLFVGGVDLFHTLAFKGMGVFPGRDSNLPTQLWIIARYMESLSLPTALIFLRRGLRPRIAFGAYALLTTAFLASAFRGVFPACYIEGVGLTPFKIISEYIIITIVIGTMTLYFKNKDKFHPKVFPLLVGSLLFTAGAEMSFTLYVDVYGFFNMLGHIFKLASFYLIYTALIALNVRDPQKMLFFELGREKERSQELNRKLAKEIDRMVRTEKNLKKSTRALNVLRKCNRAIIKAQSKEELFREICDLIVETGEYTLAWIGRAEDDKRKTVTPMAKSGEDKGYVDKIDVVWSDTDKGYGPTGKAIRTGEPCAIKDVSIDVGFSPWRPHAVQRGYVSIISIPITINGDVYGALTIYSPTKNAFDHDESELLMELANNLSYSLKVFKKQENRRRAEEELLKSEEKFRKLFHNANDMFFLSEIGKDPYSGRFIEVNDIAQINLGYTQEEFSRMSPSEIFCDIGGAGGFQASHRELRSRKQMLTEGSLQTKGGKKIPVELNTILFMLSGKEVAMAIARDITERKLTEERIRFLSFHDSLTGLYNRAYFEQELERVDSMRHFPVGLIVADVDGLKVINDTFGHEAGDAHLRLAGEILKENFRESDIVARIGGDEFGIILPHTPEKSVSNAYRRVRSKIKEYNSQNPGLPLSISLGYAVKRDNLKTMAMLFREADKNMYRQKVFQSPHAHNILLQKIIRSLERKDVYRQDRIQRLHNLISAAAGYMNLPQDSKRNLYLLANYQDIGIIGVPDKLLEKKELDDRDRKIYQDHCKNGYNILQSAPNLAHIAGHVLRHHERWDGQGYPLGLKGDKIPLECRVLSIVNTYENITCSPGCGGLGLSHEEAVELIKDGKGKEFDPALVDKFIEALETKKICDETPKVMDGDEVSGID